MLMTETKLRQIIGDEVRRKKFKRMMENAKAPGFKSYNRKMRRRMQKLLREQAAFPLANGARGPEVRALQGALGIQADGVWGPGTQAAVETRLGKATVSAEDYTTLTGIAAPGAEPAEEEEAPGEGKRYAGPAQTGSLGPAEIAILNSALAESSEPTVSYAVGGSQDLRDFWPAWSQFIMLAYEPRLVDEEGQPITGEDVLAPEVIYSQWDDVAAEKLGYPATRQGAVQFIQAKGAPAPGSAVAIALGEEDPDAGEALAKTIEGVTQAIAELGPEVDKAQDLITFPVSAGDLAACIQIFANVVKGDAADLSRSRMFTAIYAVRNTSIGELTADLGVAAVATIATGGLGAIVAAPALLYGAAKGRTLTSMVKDGKSEEAAVLNAAVSGDNEMAEDIGKVKFPISDKGPIMRDQFVNLLTNVATNGDWKKTDAMNALKKMEAPTGMSLTETVTIDDIIKMMINEVTFGVPPFTSQGPNEEQMAYGSVPGQVGAAEEEEEEEEEAAAAPVTPAPVTGGGGGGGAEARPAATSADADLAAARRRPGTYIRQTQRTERTQARQAGRSDRVATRQGNRTERRAARRERRAARRGE